MTWLQPVAEVVVAITVPMTATLLFSLRSFSQKKLQDFWKPKARV